LVGVIACVILAFLLRFMVLTYSFPGGRSRSSPVEAR
jgi:hypothetical protein